MRRAGKIATAVCVIALAVGIAACGDDDDDTTSASEGTTTTEAASADTVTVTTGNVADGYSWEVEPTPTTETTTFEYVNDSDVEHALLFARINEGFTFEEANELEGKKGSAEILAEGGARPGSTSTVKVKGTVEPGNYALFCPIPGHYQMGQLEEFEIS
jgi:uncharacterized cupredoxin-like copper-binding protein